MLDWMKRRVSTAYHQPEADAEPAKRQGRVRLLASRTARPNLLAQTVVFERAS